MRLRGTVYSKVLNMDTEITVVTPNKLQDGYKTVYLLHGRGGNSRNWIDYSMLPVYASRGNTIYIMPDGERSYYRNMKYGGRYFDWITEELPEICKHHFAVSGKREDSAIIGSSMGGSGALYCALSRPEQYGMCAAFSTGGSSLKDAINIIREDQIPPEVRANLTEQMVVDLKAIAGETLVCEDELGLFDLLQTVNQKNLLPKLFFTCGTEDPFYDGHIQFMKKMDRMGIKYGHAEFAGNHDFECFNEAMKRTIDYFCL